MDSRMNRYNNTDIENFSRSKKNASLYKEIYGNYGELENLPIDEHSNEREISNLDSLIPKRSSKKIENIIQTKEENLNINYDIKKEDKVYDINTLLEKAKEENAKIKKEILPNNKVSSNYLANLESDKQTLNLISKYDDDDESDIDTPIASEIKDIQKANTKSLSLDILADLKPTGDTQVTEPIKEEETNEKEFFSGKLKFSEEDFNKEEEFYEEEESNHTFLKIILIVIGLSSLFTAIYFILTEYFDINIF